MREIVTGTKNEDGVKGGAKKRKLTAAPVPATKASKPSANARLMRIEDITQDLKVRNHYPR